MERSSPSANSLDDKQGHDPTVPGPRAEPTLDGRRTTPPRCVARTRLAQDAADVVGRRVLADQQLAADLAVAQPLATRPRIWTSRNDSPVGGPATGRGAPSERMRPNRAGMPICRRAPSSPSSSPARSRRSRPAAAASDRARTRCGRSRCVRQPACSAHRTLEVRTRASHSPSVVASMPSGVPRRRSRRPCARSACSCLASGSSSGYSSAAVASSPRAAATSVEVGRVGEPERDPELVEALGATRASSLPASVSIPSSVSRDVSLERHAPRGWPACVSPGRARRAGPAPAGRRTSGCRTRPRSRPVSSPAPLVERLAMASASASRPRTA